MTPWKNNRIFFNSRGLSGEGTNINIAREYKSENYFMAFIQIIFEWGAVALTHLICFAFLELELFFSPWWRTFMLITLSLPVCAQSVPRGQVNEELN